ANEQPENRGHS
nr:immunoglobulin heavy chain junction region [Homo sapiens]